jgi:lipase chaperone LimK
MPGRLLGATLGVAALLCAATAIYRGRVEQAATTTVDGNKEATKTSARLNGAPPPEVPASHAAYRDPHTALQNGSLRGTQTDGGVSIGFGGHLKVDMALRHLFDYHLMLIGETDMPGIRRLLHDDLVRRELGPPLIDEVMTSFDRYVRYQQAAVTLAAQTALPLQQQLAVVIALRQRMLGNDMAEAFFGDEQRQQQQILQRLAVQSDSHLSVAEKTRALQALHDALPVNEQLAQAQIAMGNTVQNQTDAFDAAQTDAGTRHAERAQSFGADAADRLQQLDESRAQWQTRLDAYAQQSQAIQSDNSLDSAQQQAALHQLLTNSFQGTEQLQVQAMQSGGLLKTTR